MTTPFRLDRANRRIMGVAAGLADRMGWDVTLVRVAFVLLALTVAQGWGMLLYLLVGIVGADGSRD